MQRLAISLSTFALILVMLVNVALFFQNQSLRSRVSAAPAPTQAVSSADQTNQIADLKRQLERAEQDRVKATRDATAAKGQLSQLQTAAQDRDALKTKVDALTQENAQLRSQVGNLQTMNTINGQVAPLRGLTPLARVPRTFMDHGQLRTYFTDQLAKEWTPEEEARQAAVLRALDMGAPGGDLRQREIDGMVKSVLGFYDHNTKQLVVVTDRPQMGVGDRVTYAHEFTHSLQDQHYDLGALFARAEGNADYAMGIRALVEGDATLTMGLYARAHLSEMDIANYRLEELQSIDLSGLTLGGGGPLVESAAYFPYREGADFVAALYFDGGWPAVNAAFKRPPRSSEQVLHPERYILGDQPADVRLPDLRLSGWRVVAEDTLGELYLRIYLEHYLQLDQAIEACADWGGDRYQVLADGQGHQALALQTAWDNPEAAQRFYDAMAAFVAGLSGGSPATSQAGGAALRWQLADRQFYISLAGSRVLVLHAPDAATLDALIGRF